MNSGEGYYHSEELPSSPTTGRAVDPDKENLQYSSLDDAQNLQDPTGSEPVSNTKLKVRIRGWNGVASWRWVANDDTCGICRVAFDGCCPDCKLPGDDCPLVWGACKHCFHIHCIMKWLNSQQAQQLCPMCRQDWKFQED